MKVVIALPNKTGVDLSGKEGQPVYFNGDGVDLCTAATQQPVGVVVKGAASGNSDIGIRGQFPVVAAGTITGGGKAISAANGGYQDTASSAVDAGIGIAPAVAGDVVIVYLDLPLRVQA